MGAGLRNPAIAGRFERRLIGFGLPLLKPAP
jgi:hypothetical protein